VFLRWVMCEVAASRVLHLLETCVASATCLKPVCQVFSLWVTCEAAASNVLHLQ
jgi:hypothetical protein